MAPIPTPGVLWRKPPVLALAALPGSALGRLGEPSTASSAAWAAAGAAARMLHDAPLPPWPGSSVEAITSHLDGECEWLVRNGVLPTDVVTRNRRADLAVTRTRLSLAGSVHTPLFEEDRVAVVPARSPLADVESIDWLELAREPIVVKHRQRHHAAGTLAGESPTPAHRDVWEL